MFRDDESGFEDESRFRDESRVAVREEVKASEPAVVLPKGKEERAEQRSLSA